jgi:hypothetical protein
VFQCFIVTIKLAHLCLLTHVVLFYNEVLIKDHFLGGHNFFLLLTVPNFIVLVLNINHLQKET